MNTSGYSCKKCGAPISLRSGASVFAVCPYCQTAHVRSGLELEDIGQSATLVKDFSALQIGTRGRYIMPNGQSRRFELVGRLQVEWKRGYWDEWYIVFDDGSSGWLAEAQGLYYVSFPYDINQSSIGEEIKLGQIYEVNGVMYKALDFKEAEVTLSVGELPFKAVGGERYKSIDFVSSQGEFMTLARYSEGERDLFLGTVHNFTELSFENLHQLEGWRV